MRESSTIFLSPTTPVEIRMIIKGIKDARACGYDDIAVVPVIACSDISCIPFAHICSNMTKLDCFLEKK